MNEIKSGFGRIKDKFKQHFQKKIEKLQQNAVNELQKLQDFVNKQMTPTSDPNVKENIRKMNECTGSLKNLVNAIELSASEAIDKLPIIPESKDSDDSQ